MVIGLLLHMHGVAILSMLIKSFRIIMQCSNFNRLNAISEYMRKMDHYGLRDFF